MTEEELLTENISKVRELCASHVRKVPSCRYCLHFNECTKNPLACSGLAKKVYIIQKLVLPSVEMEFNRLALYPIKLKVGYISKAYMDQGTYVNVRLLIEKEYLNGNRSYVCRDQIGLTGNETREQIKAMITDAYVKAMKRKVKKNGKSRTK